MSGKNNQLLRTLFIVAALAASASISDAQEVCQKQDGKRGSAYITYERDTKSEVVFRLHNNSTCSIVVYSSSSDVPGELSDGEMVPALRRYTNFKYGRSGITVGVTGGGDVFYAHVLKGGRSLLFAIPRKSIKAREMICVRFEFEWELKPLRRSPGVGYSGDTYHFAYASYSELPQSVFQK